MPMPRKQRNPCLVCGKPCSRAPGNLGSTYCSGRCHKEHAYALYIQAWLRGEVSGARGQPVFLNTYAVGLLKNTGSVVLNVVGLNETLLQVEFRLK